MEYRVLKCFMCLNSAKWRVAFWFTFCD